jgi:galactose mutarotase-like enzyme
MPKGFSTFRSSAPYLHEARCAGQRMAVAGRPNDHAWSHIRSSELTAEINPLGAQLSSFKDRNGLDLLWDGDPSFWNGRAPLLFPIVGTVANGRYHLDGRSFPLSRHGFARDKLFEVTRATESAATFRLRADEGTFAVYPFHFELDTCFHLKGRTLAIRTQIRNMDSEPMPASFGYHPAFRWPLPYGQAREDHRLEFETEEQGVVRRIDSSGLMLPAPQPSPVAGRHLELQDGLFNQDVLILEQPRSRSVVYGAARGARLRVSFPTATYLGLWSKPGAPFLCIEPWEGVTDPVGFAGDFRQKPGVFQIAPGELKTIAISVEWLAGLE